MNFLDYLCEESKEKNLYVLYNKRSKYALTHHGEIFETWAVTPEKARANILYRLKNDEPDRYYDDVRHNQEDYEVIPKETYKNLMADRERKNNPLPEIEHPKPKTSGQQDMFINDPTNALQFGL